MVKVYYCKIDNSTSVEEVQRITRELLDKIVVEEKIEFEKEVPLKVHFGEKGNVTFVKPENYCGVIDYLKGRGIDTFYIETTVMYGGERCEKESHIRLAKEHGFNQVPIIIADGDYGEEFYGVEINKRHFEKCKLGKEFEKYKQLIVFSHFKGHMMAGFGGAIKQLAMGFGSKGGKIAMHIGEKPHIVNWKCKKCNLCKSRCSVDAITISDKKSFIDEDICVGCGGCMAICPNNAISIYSIKGVVKAVGGIGDPFREKLVEYAYAAHKGRKNIYINFVTNVTSGCDCEPREMTPVIDDVGIFVSTDPVAIDRACYDIVKERGKEFRGVKQFEYAENIGLGSQEYDLIEI